MKGITPVIAIVLLLMITIAMVGFAFVWFQGMWQQTSETTGSQIEAQQQSMMKTIAIDNVNCAGGIIYIRNTGSVSIANTDLTVYVDGAKSPCVVAPATLTAGTIGTCTHGSAITTGKAVKVTSPGSVDETKC